MDYQEEYNQMMLEAIKNQQRFRYAVIIIVAFVLGFVIAWLSFKSQNDPNSIDKEKESSNKIEAVIPKEKSLENSLNELRGDSASESSVKIGNDASLLVEVTLSVDNQAPGKTVFVKELRAEKPVWVVIVENNNGEHGNILGAGLFDVGESAGLVELLRGTVQGGTYYAVMHNENSNLTQDRLFEPELDLPILYSNNQVVEVMFETSSDAE
jgi:hypothetical protein